MRQASDDGRGAPDAGRATRFSAAARSTGGFDRLLRTLRAICRCSRRPKGRPCVSQRPGIWESRLRTLGETVDWAYLALRIGGELLWLASNPG